MFKTVLRSGTLLTCGALAMALLGAARSAAEGRANHAKKPRSMHVVLFRTLETTPNRLLGPKQKKTQKSSRSSGGENPVSTSDCQVWSPDGHAVGRVSVRAPA